jgi:hypothetical protein
MKNLPLRSQTWRGMLRQSQIRQKQKYQLEVPRKFLMLVVRATDMGIRIARQTVFHTALLPARLTLPVIPR